MGKKVPPPTPDGREGRLFPPEQSSKAAPVVNELINGGNTILISRSILREKVPFCLYAIAC